MTISSGRIPGSCWSFCFTLHFLFYVTQHSSCPDTASRFQRLLALLPLTQNLFSRGSFPGCGSLHMHGACTAIRNGQMQLVNVALPFPADLEQPSLPHPGGTQHVAQGSQSQGISHPSNIIALGSGRPGVSWAWDFGSPRRSTANPPAAAGECAPTPQIWPSTGTGLSCCSIPWADSTAPLWAEAFFCKGMKTKAGWIRCTAGQPWRARAKGNITMPVEQEIQL